MSDAEIKQCPFCGSTPRLRIDKASNFGRDCWSWIDCVRCWVRPHIGACVSLGYYQIAHPHDWVPLRTEAEASAEATATVIRRWNERAPC